MAGWRIIIEAINNLDAHESRVAIPVSSHTERLAKDKVGNPLVANRRVFKI